MRFPVREIVLPETQPETEWIDGRAVQKMSPTYQHQRLEREIESALRGWCRPNHGRVASEWRMRVTPPGEATRPLVPDVAYVSYEVLPRDASASDVATPLVAPTVSFEVLSPGQRRATMEAKSRTFLASGTQLVAIVDPATETMTFVRADGSTATYGRGDVAFDRSMPGFALDVAAIFDAAAD